MLQVFYDWMEKNKSTVAPDQDFLNMFCKNKVTYLPSGWNEMPIGQELAGDELYIIHYNMFQKPWKYKGIMYEKYFWNQAQKSIYYRKLKKQQATYTDEQKKNDLTAMEKLIKLTKDIAQKCRKKGPVNA